MTENRKVSGSKASEGETLAEIIAALKTGEFRTLDKVPDGGSLQIRRLSTGTIAFYWRYSHGGKVDRVSFGIYDSSLPPKSLTPKGKRFSRVAALDRKSVV